MTVVFELVQQQSSSEQMMESDESKGIELRWIERLNRRSGRRIESRERSKESQEVEAEVEAEVQSRCLNDFSLWLLFTDLAAWGFDAMQSQQDQDQSGGTFLFLYLVFSLARNLH